MMKYRLAHTLIVLVAWNDEMLQKYHLPFLWFFRKVKSSLTSLTKYFGKKNTRLFCCPSTCTNETPIMVVNCAPPKKKIIIENKETKLYQTSYQYCLHAVMFSLSYRNFNIPLQLPLQHEQNASHTLPESNGVMEIGRA